MQRFLTALLVVDDPAAGMIRYCGAGHPSARLRMPGGEGFSLKSQGLPLNLALPDVVERRSLSVPRQEGSRLFMCTDGFTEAATDDGKPFYENPAYRETVEEALSHPPLTARKKLEAALLVHTKGRPQDDDRAFLVAELL